MCGPYYNLDDTAIFYAELLEDGTYQVRSCGRMISQIWDPDGFEN